MKFAILDFTRANKGIPAHIVLTAMTLTTTVFKCVNCINEITDQLYNHPGNGIRYPGNNFPTREQQRQMNPNSYHHYLKSNEKQLYRFYMDPSHVSKVITSSSGRIHGNPDSFHVYRHQPLFPQSIDRQDYNHDAKDDRDEISIEHNESHKSSSPQQHSIEVTSSGSEHHSDHNGEHHSDYNSNYESDQSPFEIALEDLTSPDKLLPVINNLTFMALVILHMPAIVPTILIPLAFFCVGALLIPIVRVNYFINHKDDGEDGRSFL